MFSRRPREHEQFLLCLWKVTNWFWLGVQCDVPRRLCSGVSKSLQQTGHALGSGKWNGEEIYVAVGPSGDRCFGEPQVDLEGVDLSWFEIIKVKFKNGTWLFEKEILRWLARPVHRAVSRQQRPLALPEDRYTRRLLFLWDARLWEKVGALARPVLSWELTCVSCGLHQLQSGHLHIRGPKLQEYGNPGQETFNSRLRIRRNAYQRTDPTYGGLHYGKPVDGQKNCNSCARNLRWSRL